MSDLVSIIMPSYNTAQYITETIQSVIFFYCIKLFDYYIFCNNWSTSYSMSLVKI